MTSPCDEFARLREIVEVLRGAQGCPWDREQTLRDICRYLLEESAELADAVSDARGEASPAACEELGDVLMNVLLACRIAEEDGAFDVDDVTRGIREKLIRRHPHVFGDVKLKDSKEVLAQWEKIKNAERSGGGDAPDGDSFRSRLAGIPRSLPPLARAYKLSARAARHGFDWPEASGALAKVQEELEEVRSLLEGGAAPPTSEARFRLEGELGDLLFATVNVCRKLGVHPDDALRTTLKKFRERFETIERRLPNLEEASLEEMDEIWDEIRSGLRPEMRSPPAPPEPGADAPSRN
ncbi:MAG: nucleoside triphosphate pyrophosphohydrolase [Planctomycetota bacterium]|nr:nucleoside triphosphate pyrophosphohydrolase [Planctomycetota bacterium]